VQGGVLGKVDDSTAARAFGDQSCCTANLFALQSARSNAMSLLGILLVIVGVVLAIKVAGAVVRLLMVVLVIGGLYLLFGPMLGLPGIG
jgi:hypothetical protein